MVGTIAFGSRAIWAVNHAAATASRWMFSRFGVTFRQHLILHVVAVRPGISYGRLARVLHLDPSSLTGVIALLIKRDCLSVRVDRRDRRRCRLQVKALGARIVKNSAGAIETAIQNVYAQASPLDMKSAHEVLRLLAGNLSRFTK